MKKVLLYLSRFVLNAFSELEFALPDAEYHHSLSHPSFKAIHIFSKLEAEDMAAKVA